jgi:hypothetical protein
MSGIRVCTMAEVMKGEEEEHHGSIHLKIYELT